LSQQPRQNSSSQSSSSFSPVRSRFLARLCGSQSHHGARELIPPPLFPRQIGSSHGLGSHRLRLRTSATGRGGGEVSRPHGRERGIRGPKPPQLGERKRGDNQRSTKGEVGNKGGRGSTMLSSGVRGAECAGGAHPRPLHRLVHLVLPHLTPSLLSSESEGEEPRPSADGGCGEWR
jgi:hypothetical protein